MLGAVHLDKVAYSAVLRFLGRPKLYPLTEAERAALLQIVQTGAG
jgi:hypothetical protein